MHHNSRRSKKGRNFWGCMLLCFLIVLLGAAIGIGISGRGVLEKIRYLWFGSGTMYWEKKAEEEEIVSTSEEYYYEHLPEDLQDTYRELFVRIVRGESSGNLTTTVGVDEFWQVYYAVTADHPEIFWIGSSAQVRESTLTRWVVDYELETIVPQEARESMAEQIRAAADQCISQIPPDTSDYGKIKAVYEYLIETTEYDAESPDTQNIQSALLYHSSVCAGYSKAFQYILHRMGMFCTYITGMIKEGGDHGWNMVRIDGTYYYVDVTWGDPVFANQIEGSSENVINYNYLCCTEEELFQTHEPDGSVELPSCTSDAYNYYKLNGYYYEDFDRSAIYNALMNSVWEGDRSIVMKFGSREAFDTAVYELFEGGLLKDPGQYLMEINGVSTWNYRYHTDDKFYLVTIYWI